MILFLLAVTAVFHPSAPTVGDRITVRFPAAVVLEADPSYEIVFVKGDTAVVRTFRPEPITLRGRAGAARFQNLSIPVSSVLKSDDLLQPAPLAAPKPPTYARRPFIAIALMALLAAITWLLAWYRSRQRVRAVTPSEPPHERFRRAVSALRDRRDATLRWAALADETRRYLAATRPALGMELTTTEVLRRLHREDVLVREILSQGDLEKFSPWGAAPIDFDSVAERALTMASPPPEIDRGAAA